MQDCVKKFLVFCAKIWVVLAVTLWVLFGASVLTNSALERLKNRRECPCFEAGCCVRDSIACPGAAKCFCEWDTAHCAAELKVDKRLDDGTDVVDMLEHTFLACAVALTLVPAVICVVVGVLWGFRECMSWCCSRNVLQDEERQLYDERVRLLERHHPVEQGPPPGLHPFPPPPFPRHYPLSEMPPPPPGPNPHWS